MVRIETLKINQIIVKEMNGNQTFFSYDTPICTKLHNGPVVLHDAWNYSVTTSKYRGQFLNEGLDATRKKLLDGTYTLKGYYAED